MNPRFNVYRFLQTHDSLYEPRLPQLLESLRRSLVSPPEDDPAALEFAATIERQLLSKLRALNSPHALLCLLADTAGTNLVAI